MPIGAEFRDHVLDLLAPWGSVEVKSMFGGAGLYLDGAIFGMIGGDVLYLKVDDTNREAFESTAMEAFAPFPGKSCRMPYYRVPDEVMESPDELCAWARRSWEVSRRAKGARG